MKRNLCDNVNAAQVLATKFVVKFLTSERLECRGFLRQRSDGTSCCLASPANSRSDQAGFLI